MRSPWHALRVPAAKSCSYSFSVEPHPAALVMTASKSSRRKTSRFVRASDRAASRTPACAASAPQQVCPAGTTTSQPLAVSTRIVASCSAEKLTCAMHPGKQRHARAAMAHGRDTFGPASRRKICDRSAAAAARDPQGRADGECRSRARAIAIPSAGRYVERARDDCDAARDREAGGEKQNRA